MPQRTDGRHLAGDQSAPSPRDRAAARSGRPRRSGSQGRPACGPRRRRCARRPRRARRPGRPRRCSLPVRRSRATQIAVNGGRTKSWRRSPTSATSGTTARNQPSASAAVRFIFQLVPISRRRHHARLRQRAAQARPSACVGQLRRRSGRRTRRPASGVPPAALAEAGRAADRRRPSRRSPRRRHGLPVARPAMATSSGAPGLVGGGQGGGDRRQHVDDRLVPRSRVTQCLDGLQRGLGTPPQPRDGQRRLVGRTYRPGRTPPRSSARRTGVRSRRPAPRHAARGSPDEPAGSSSGLADRPRRTAARADRHGHAVIAVARLGVQRAERARARPRRRRPRTGWPLGARRSSAQPRACGPARRATQGARRPGRAR